MNLDEVKDFLKIDFDDDDSSLLLMTLAAEGYILDAVGEYNSENPRHRLLLCTLISTMYESRSFTADKASEKVAYVIKSMVQQLQLGGV